ncbi:hypothetical protein DC439_23545 [Agrobacterium tumefaciens]|nr:hypothetical protein DC439_23545 [Agrobacterium tumefaciens]
MKIPFFCAFDRHKVAAQICVLCMAIFIVENSWRLVRFSRPQAWNDIALHILNVILGLDPRILTRGKQWILGSSPRMTEERLPKQKRPQSGRLGIQ